MAYLVTLLAILCCEQVVGSSFNTFYVNKTLKEARQQCDTGRLVLPRTMESNVMWAEQIERLHIRATWIDLTISTSPWNWITDVGYTINYDQGCYSLSSQHDQWMITLNNADVSTCMEFCEVHLYVGVQLISNDHLNCVCTNETEIASAVSENECGANCNIAGIKQACGKTSPESSTHRLLSTQYLHLSLMEGKITWRDNPDLNITSPFLCASLSIRILTDFQPPHISLIPQNCNAELPAICESENGTINITKPMSWFEAQKQCREYGMKMARLSSAYQPNILELPVEQEGWVALRGWVWSSRAHETRDLFYTNWSAGYPRKSEGDCIIVLKDGSWKNVPCDAGKSFLCETTPSSTSLNTSPSVTMPTMTDIIHTAPSHVNVTPKSGSGAEIVVAAAVGTSIGILVLIAVAVIAIICLRKKKPALPHSNYGSGDPDDDELPAPSTTDYINAMLEINGENILGHSAMPEQIPRMPSPQLGERPAKTRQDALWTNVYEMPERFSAPHVQVYATLGDVN